MSSSGSVWHWLRTGLERHSAEAVGDVKARVAQATHEMKDVQPAQIWPKALPYLKEDERRLAGWRPAEESGRALQRFKFSTLDTVAKVPRIRNTRSDA